MESTLPSGRVLVFDDWQVARIEAQMHGYALGIVLVPEPVIDALAPDPPPPTDPAPD